MGKIRRLLAILLCITMTFSTNYSNVVWASSVGEGDMPSEEVTTQEVIETEDETTRQEPESSEETIEVGDDSDESESAEAVSEDTDVPAEEEVSPSEETTTDESDAVNDETVDTESITEENTEEVQLRDSSATTQSSGTCGDNITWELSEDGTLTLSGTGETYEYGTVYELDPWGEPLDSHFVWVPWSSQFSLVKKIVVGEGITSIASEIFAHEYNLSEVILPDSLLYIKGGRIYNCDSLHNFHIPKNLISGAEFRDNNIETFTVDEENEHYFVVDGCLYNTDENGKTSLSILIPGGKSELSIPAGVNNVWLKNSTSIHKFNCSRRVNDCTITFDELDSSQNWEIYFDGVVPESFNLPWTQLDDEAMYGRLTIYYPENDSSWESWIEENSGKISPLITFDTHEVCPLEEDPDFSVELRDEEGNIISELPTDQYSGYVEGYNKYVKVHYGYETFEGEEFVRYIWCPNWYPSGNKVGLCECELEMTSENNGGTHNDNSFEKLFGTYRLSVKLNFYYDYGDYSIHLNDEGTVFTLKGNGRIPDDLRFYNLNMFDCTKVKKIVIDEGIENIPYGAFFVLDETEDFSNVESLELPDSLTEIGESAFYGMPNLSGTLRVPRNLTSVGRAAFGYNVLIVPTDRENLFDKVIYPEGIEEIIHIPGIQAREVSLPESAKTINDYAFDRWPMTEISIPDGVTSIGKGAFSDSGLVGNIVLPDGLESISSNAFENTKITSINIPETVTEIGENAFKGCSKLEVNAEDLANIKKFGKQAFFGCKLTGSLNLSEQVTEIGSMAFAGNSNLTAINVDGNNAAYASIDGVLYDKEFSTLMQIPQKKTGEITVPETVVYIDKYAGQYSSLDKITILGNVESISDSAFAYSTIKNMVLPESVKTIGDSAFSDDNLLEEVNLPDGLTAIGSYAFNGCSSLEEINLADGITSIGSSAFSDCSSLKNIHLPVKLTTISAGCFRGCSGIESDIIVPFGVKYIYSEAFYGCSKIKKYVFPQGVTRLGSACIGGEGAEADIYLFMKFNGESSGDTYMRRMIDYTNANYTIYTRTDDTTWTPSGISWISFTYSNENSSVAWKTLSTCGDSHEFGEWIITKEPTFDEAGERQRACYQCGYVEIETIPALEAAALVGDQKYTSLQEAIDQITSEENVTIVLQKNIEESITIPYGKVITLNLNGYSISCSGENAVIINRGKLFIKNESTSTLNSLLKSAKLFRGGAPAGSIVASDENGVAICNYNEMTLLSGTVEGDIINSSTQGTNASLTMEGGSVNGDLIVAQNGDESVSNTVTIHDGTLSGEICESVEGDDGNLTPITDPEESTAQINITGGSFSTDISDYLEPGYTVIDNGDGSYTVQEGPAPLDISQLTYSLDAVDYDGQSHSISVSGPEGIGEITVSYNGSTAAPTNAGTYEVTVTITEGTLYQGVDNASLGSFTINKVTPEISISAVLQNERESVEEGTIGYAGDAIRLSADVKDIAGQTFTAGYVEFYNNTELVGSVAINEEHIEYVVENTTAGTYQFKAKFIPDQADENNYQVTESEVVDVSLAELIPVSMEITTLPTKIEYTDEDTFDPAGMVVEVTYNSGDVKTETEYEVDTQNNLVYGTESVTISFGEVTASVGVTVTHAEAAYRVNTNDNLIEKYCPACGTVLGTARLEPPAEEEVNRAGSEVNIILTGEMTDEDYLLKYYTRTASGDEELTTENGLPNLSGSYVAKLICADDVVIEQPFTLTAAVTGITLDHHYYVLEENTTGQLQANILPEDATNKNFTWSSTDENVVTVDEAGVVTAVAEGEAGITVTTEEGVFTDTCSIIVIESGSTFGSCGKDAWWKYKDGTFTVFGSGDTDTTLKTTVAKYRDSIQTVIIEGGITGIASYAFQYCRNVTTLSLSEGLKTIGEYAFSNCTGLMEVVLPKSLQTLTGYAFQSCTNLESFTVQSESLNIQWSYNQYYYNVLDRAGTAKENGIHLIFTDNVKTVPANMLYTYSGGVSSGSRPPKVTKVTIGNNVETIGKNAFWGIPTIKEIALPASVKTLETGSLSSMTGLEKINIPGGCSVTAGALSGSGSNDGFWINLEEGNSSLETNLARANTKLTKLTLPSSLRSIGANALERCSGLKEITLPEGLETIGEYAFAECTGLTEVVLPKSLQTLTGYAFQNCTNLERFTVQSESLNIQWSYNQYYYNVLDRAGTAKEKGIHLIFTDNVKTVPANMLYTYSGGVSSGSKPPKVTKVTIGNNVETIGKNAFWGIPTIKEIVLPASVKTIETGSFSSMAGLEKINIPGGCSITAGALNGSGSDDGFWIDLEEGNSSLETNLARANTKLTKLTLPSSLRSIGANALEGCTGLKEITLPEGLGTIGDHAFKGCTGLTEVVLPKSLQTLTGYAFQNCTNLESFTVQSESLNIQWYYNSNCYNVLDNAGTAKENGIHLIFTDNVKTVPVHMLYTYCGGVSSGSKPPKVTKVTIGNNVETIGDGAFWGIPTIKEIALPASVKTLETGSLSSMTGLEKINIPGGCSVTAGALSGSGSDNGFWIDLEEGNSSLETNLARANTKLTKLTLPSSLRSIGANALERCSGLKEITLPEGLGTIGDHAFEDCTGLTEVVLPKSLQTLNGYAFQDCTNLESFTVQSESLNIQWYYNNNYYNVLDNAGTAKENGIHLIFTDNVKTVPAHMLYTYCGGISSGSKPPKVTKVTIGNNVETIGDGAFCLNPTIKEIVLPASVKTLENGSFSGMAGLEKINIPGGCSVTAGALSGSGSDDGFWIDLEEGNSSLETNLARANTKLTKLTLPSSLRSIGANALERCSGLKEIILPEGLETIGDHAFEDCTGLTEVVLPKSLQTLNGYAFQDCTNLESFTVQSESLNIQWYYNKYYYNVLDNAGTAKENGIHMIFTDNVKTVPANMLNTYCGGISSGSKLPNVTAITLGRNVETIGDNAFLGCKGVDSLTFGNSIRKIGNYAFYGMDGLESVTIPAGIDAISGNTFASCKNLQSINVADGNEDLSSEDGVLYDKDKTTLLTYPAGKSNETSIEILSSVETIGDGAFDGNNYLESIKILDTVTTIAEDAFDNRETKLTLKGYRGSYVHDYYNELENDLIEFEFLDQVDDGTVPVIRAGNLELEGMILLNIYATVPEGTDNARMNFKVVGYDNNVSYEEVCEWDSTRTYEVKSETATYICHKFSLPLAAKQMADKVICRLDVQVNGETKSSISFSYSVEKYCKNMLKDKTIGSSPYFRDLLGAMTNYGTAAQEYFEYGESHLVSGVQNKMDSGQNEAMNSNLSGELMTLEQMRENYAMTWNRIDNPRSAIYGVSLILESDVIVRVYAEKSKIQEGDRLCYVRESDNTAIDTQEKYLDFQSLNDDLYYADITGIAAQDLDDKFTMYVCGADDQQVSNAVVYGPMTYACNQWNSNIPGLAQLVQMLQVYNVAAENYFNNKN